MELFGGIEAGGTKFVCMVATGPEHVVAEARIETSSPHDTLDRVIDFFQPFRIRREIKAVGIGCFGPIDPDPHSPTFGFITTTPKPGWQNVDVLGPVRDALGVPVGFDMDVNAAALGEQLWGASRGRDPALYVTLGTGIGGGYIVDGKPLHGLVNPEMGHIRVAHDLGQDPFPGSCPYHQDCFEGLASGSALAARFGVRGELLRDDDPFWVLEAGYIASALATYIIVLSPRIVVLGGGIMDRSFMFPLIREKVQATLAGYVKNEFLEGEIGQYIVPPKLGARAGVFGAIALAMGMSADAGSITS